MVTTSNRETRGFQSEIRQLLHLMIHSLYSNEEIFLRELISNAADAIDKLKFAALSNEALYEGQADLRIEIEFDEKKHTITVRDNGIGMSRDEVIEHLGTIAKSGTKEFFAGLTGDARQDAQLIGQFGVGFYSSFIVADKVTVLTRKAGLEPAAGVRWESSGEGEFTVESLPIETRGTEVTLHLRKEARDFADAHRLRRIVKQYSDHIAIPIRMKPVSGEGEFETVNTATALWTRNKKDISDDEYREFYRHVAHDFEDPLSWAHNRVEGKLDYTMLLYLPKRAPFDLWDRQAKHGGLKLYVQRVFVLESSEELLPRYLRFVRGVIDTNDLPLNVSRELLQRNKAIDTIRGAAVKKVLGLIEKLAKGEEYPAFWKAFGTLLKEGVVEDDEQRGRLAELLRFSSTREDKAEPDVSLPAYVERMQPGQKGIYYLIADGFTTAKSSPHLEAFRAKNIEVLLLSEPIDEWLVTHLHEYADKPLLSATRGTLELDEAEGEKKDATEGADAEHGELVARIKQALATKVKDVRVSKRLTSSPACLVADDYAMSANLERILKAAGQSVEPAKRILEINPKHPIVTRLAGITADEQVAFWSEILLGQAVLAEGGKLDDPAAFVARLNEALGELAGPSAG
ncbi:MAG: molecular chaperone HtpG [Gammaproteobacteria bacterium]|nr:molecular chaperone HtpG [Gammaproteobacteria bacterium]